MGEKKGKRQTSKITNKAVKRVKRGILTAGTIIFVGGALVGTAFSNNTKSIKESVMEHFRNKHNSSTTISIDEGEKTQPLSEGTSKGPERPATVSSPVGHKSLAVNTIYGFNPKNTLVLGVNLPKIEGGPNSENGSNTLFIDDQIKQDFEVNTSQQTQFISSEQKEKGLAISFGAGSMMYVAGDNINFDMAMGVALSTKLSDHATFFTELIAGTGIPLNKGATVSDLMHNSAFMAKVGVTISFGGKRVAQVTPDIYAIKGVIGHNVQNKNNGGSSSGGQDKPTEEGTIDYDTTLPNNGNDSLGTDGDTVVIINPEDNNFGGNDSFGFDFEQ